MSIHPVTPCSCPQKGNFQKLSDSITFSIFSFLPPTEVAKCCQLSSYFNTIGDRSLWKSLVAQSWGKEWVKKFAPLVDKGLITWKKVFSYRPLVSTLFTSHDLPREEMVKKYRNMREVRENFFYDPNKFIPQPQIVEKDARYLIANCSDIEIQKTGGAQLLKGEENVYLSNIAHDGMYLYAFCHLGYVIQWNLNTEEKTRIDTAYTKQDPLIEKFKISDAICRFLLVKDGFLVIDYGPIFEVIEISTKKSVMINEQELALYPDKIAIWNKKLYIVDCCRIFIWDLKEGKFETSFHIDMPEHSRVSDVAFHQNLIYIYAAQGIDRKVYAYDLQTGAEVKELRLTFTKNGMTTYGYTDYGNRKPLEERCVLLGQRLLLKADQYIFVVDVKAGTQIGDAACIETETNEIDPNGLEKLITIFQQEIVKQVK